MATCISNSPKETEALGQTWAQQARKGWIIGLQGELGAGKTQLVRGLANGLGIRQRVHSPTFAIINIYEGGTLTLFHLDLYRLETPDQLLSAGIEEYLVPDGVAVIEWAERLLWLQPEEAFAPRRSVAPSLSSQQVRLGLSHLARQAPLRWVRFESPSETVRHIHYEDFGS